MTSIPAPPAVHAFDFEILPEFVDANGHVNNVHYVQWMQDAAVRHFRALGGSDPMRTAGATWVVHSHHVEYLSPAFAGDRIQVQTWVADLRRVRSLRRYRFVRLSDDRLLVRGETEWVFVDAGTGRPKAIPETISSLLPLMPQGPES